MIKDDQWILDHLKRYGNCSISRKRLIKGKDVDLLAMLKRNGYNCEIICKEHYNTKKSSSEYPERQGYLLQVVK